jgi:multidrug efflux pump subunit AcrA (membrane-fusion protein)
MMSARLLLPLLLVLLPVNVRAADRPAAVVLDAVSVENLRIQTVVTEPADFERTVFALGRIAVYPGRRAAISSRVPGRAVEVAIKHDHPVRQGDRAILVESRQPGDPPPVLTLTAPISGLVSAVHVVPGEPVSPDKVLAEIVDLTEVYALARVPQHLAAQLASGQVARIAVPAAGDEPFVAHLEHLGAEADPQSGTVEAAFHVENPRQLLRPGMRAEFSIVTGRRTAVTAVPREAVQGTGAERFVFVKDFELPHAFVKTPVVTGEANDRFIEIVRGLFPADEVVTQGAYALAFAGSGTVSLKEALDAAHGHEHNPDGSEINGASASSAVHDHGHDDHAHDDHGHAFWKWVSASLFVALLVVAFGRTREAKAGAR